MDASGRSMRGSQPFVWMSLVTSHNRTKKRVDYDFYKQKRLNVIEKYGELSNIPSRI